jgi:hypothetical protein
VSSWSARSTPATPPHAKVLTLPQAAPELARSWGQNSSLSPTAPYAKALEVPGGKRSRTGVLPGCSAAMDGSGSGWTGRHVHAVEIRKNPADGGLVGRAGTGEHRSTLALNPRVRGSSPWRRTTENGLRAGASRQIGAFFVCTSDRTGHQRGVRPKVPRGTPDRTSYVSPPSNFLFGQAFTLRGDGQVP